MSAAPHAPPAWTRREVIGDSTLYLGDALEVLPILDRWDAIIADPPYGIDHASNRDGTHWRGTAIAGDADTTSRDRALAIRSVPFACFCAPLAPPPERSENVLVWDKGPASGMGDLSFPWKRSFEFVYLSRGAWVGRRDEGVIRGCNVVTWVTMGRQHPHQKPTTLLERIIDKAAPEWVIADPFMGSGTTGVACANLGRSFVGIEIDPTYFEIACERIDAAQRQSRLFA